MAADETLQIRMLGEFSLEYRGKKLLCSHTNKSWNMLAYLIYYHERSIPQNELFTLLWGEDDASEDPQNAFKAMMFRVRGLLNTLEEGLGKRWLFSKKGCCFWKPDVPFTLDTDEFTRLYQEAESAPIGSEARLRLYLQAIDAFYGDFLPTFSAMEWVMPTLTFFYTQFRRAADEAVAMLRELADYEQAVRVCRIRLRYEPFSENATLQLLRNLVDAGQYQEAISEYELYMEHLFAEEGAVPDEAIRAIYREAFSRDEAPPLSTDSLFEQVQQFTIPSGAILCDYDFFRMMVQAHARWIVRSGESVQLLLFSVASPRGGTPLSRRTLQNVLKNFVALAQRHLRAGDVITQASFSQLLVLLPKASVANGESVCERLLAAFRRNYPHSPAEITYSIQSVTPAPGFRPYLPPAAAEPASV